MTKCRDHTVYLTLCRQSTGRVKHAILSPVTRRLYVEYLVSVQHLLIFLGPKNIRVSGFKHEKNFKVDRLDFFLFLIFYYHRL